MAEAPGLVMSCVAENAGWCALICRTHGIGIERAGGWTRTLRPAPPYHPDLITLDPTVSSVEVAEQLQDRPSCSVKDSFGVLDLASAGFERLFDAEWLAFTDAEGEVREPDAPQACGPARVMPGWHQVTDVETFRRWSAGVEPDSSLRPALIDDEGTRVWLLDEGPTRAGFVAHRTGPVVALTNAYSEGMDGATFWRERGTLANRGWGSASGSLRVVTYESGDDLTAAREAGLSSLGPLTVWRRGG